MHSYKHTELRCSNCCLKFSGEYWHGGAIEHNNVISNIHVYIREWNDESCGKISIFNELINLHGNMCSKGDRTYKVGIQVYECILGYLKHNGPSDMYRWLYDKRGDIVDEYIKVRQHFRAMAADELANQNKILDELMDIKREQNDA